MKLYRPHVPLAVGIAVAERQLGYGLPALVHVSKRQYLAALLWRLFNGQRAHLDHDPPLMLRSFNEKKRTYTPDANDPNYLIWRTAENHRIKTFVRGDGAQLSDAAKRRKEIKRRKKKTARKKPWPPGRKLQSRPLRGRR